MRLSNVRIPWDDFPLAENPFVVERDTWETGVDGGAEYVGSRIGRYPTWERAMEVASATSGAVLIYQFRRNPKGGEGGGSIAHFWNGKLREPLDSIATLML